MRFSLKNCLVGTKRQDLLHIPGELDPVGPRVMPGQKCGTVMYRTNGGAIFVMLLMLDHVGSKAKWIKQLRN